MLTRKNFDNNGTQPFFHEFFSSEGRRDSETPISPRVQPKLILFLNIEVEEPLRFSKLNK